jgi:hypothetical protein
VLVASGFEVYGVLKEKTTVDENIVEGVRELMAQLKKGIRSISSSASNKQLQVSERCFKWSTDSIRSGRVVQSI